MSAVIAISSFFHFFACLHLSSHVTVVCGLGRPVILCTFMFVYSHSFQEQLFNINLWSMPSICALSFPCTWIIWAWCLSVHWLLGHKPFIVSCSNHFSFLLSPSSLLLLCSLVFLYVTSIITTLPSTPHLVSFLLPLSCLISLYSPIPASLCHPSSVVHGHLLCLAQAGGTCGPSWTVPCRTSVTCIFWWRRRRSRQCAELC